MPVTLSHSTAKYFLFLILSFGCKVFAHEQSDDLQKLGAADGLSQGMVYQISQDRNGFLWIGTKNGLNRFDGFQFYPLDSTTNGMDISNITITCQMEDEYGRLWIGTEGEGLFILDQKSGLVYPCVARKGNTAIPAHILNIKQNEGGNIWIGAFKGLYKVDPQAIEFPGSEKQSVEVVLDQVYRAEGFCRAIHFQKDRVFWSEDQRVFSASLKHFGIFQEHTSEWQTGLRSGSINIEHIFEDKRGQLWIVRSHAITIVNKDWVVHHYFNVPTSSPKIGFAQVSDSSFLVSANYLKLVHADGSGTLVSDTLSYLNNFYARDVFRDHSGMIWMGTNGYGLLKFNPFRQQLGHIAEGRSFQNISKISPGRILAWSQFALWEIDAQWNSISKSKDIPPYLLTARNVITDSQGKLWFHFPNKDQAPALVSWNPANGSIDSILYNALPYYISPMYKDTEGLLWMASTDGVLMRINLTKKEVQYFDFKSMASKEGSALFINSIYQDKAGIYWLATSVGLFEFKLIQNSIQNLKYHSLQKEKVMPYYVFEVLADEKEDGLLWLCTRGNGLVKFHKKKGVLKVYTKKSGLPDNVVYGAISSGRALWLSTNKGLSVFDQESERFRNFKKGEGLQDDEFNSKAFLKISDSLFVFGGINGLNIINPNLSYENPHPPKVAITEVRIFDRPYLNAPILSGLSRPAMTFQHDENHLTIEFAALDFRAPEQNRFQYYLQGGENKWIELGNNRQIILSNLAPGKYVFRLKGSNNSGVWSVEEAVFNFTILPPWWLSMPAMLLYFVMVGSIGFGFYKYQINRVELKNKLAYEQKEAERLLELDKLKSIFFSNITHEFKTPITLILEPIRQLLKGKHAPQDQEKLQLAERNSQKLLKLVNQLLDLSKLDEGKMKVEASEGDLKVWLQEIATDYKSWAIKKQLQFTTRFPEPNILVLFDHQKLELILANILSNAFKFSPDGGKVSWVVEAVQGNGQYDISMQFSDEGPGIPEAEQERIFDRFHQVENDINLAGGGTGIGLALAKELADLLGGKISVQSKPGRGTTFTLQCSFPAAEEPGADTILPSAGGKSIHREQSHIHKKWNAESEALPQVLVIEDNAELAQFIGSTLAPYYQIRLAYDGQEGVQKAIEHLPDLIISDVMMPVKNGFEVCEDLKTNWLTSHIPIILLTAKSAIEHKIAGLRTGADDYLSKPFYTEELLARIENLLNARKLLKEKYSAGSEVLNKGEKHWLGLDFSAQEREFLRKIDQLLVEHLDQEAFSVEDLAEPLFVSRVQLYRKLKAMTGQSPSDYIRNFRLEEARRLLESGQCNVNEAVLQTGFASRQYFTKAFKAKFGYPPGELSKGQ